MNTLTSLLLYYIKVLCLINKTIKERTEGPGVIFNSREPSLGSSTKTREVPLQTMQQDSREETLRVEALQETELELSTWPSSPSRM